VRIDARSWQAPPVFNWMAKAGNIDAEEMARTFNCGIGLVVVTAPSDADAVAKVLVEHGERVFRIGTVEANVTEHQVVLDNLDKVWPC